MLTVTPKQPNDDEYTRVSNEVSFLLMLHENKKNLQILTTNCSLRIQEIVIFPPFTFFFFFKIVYGCKVLKELWLNFK